MLHIIYCILEVTMVLLLLAVAICDIITAINTYKRDDDIYDLLEQEKEAHHE